MKLHIISALIGLLWIGYSFFIIDQCVGGFLSEPSSSGSGLICSQPLFVLALPLLIAVLFFALLNLPLLGYVAAWLGATLIVRAVIALVIAIRHRSILGKK